MNAMDALNRARRAWEASQPQYVIPGLDDHPLTAGLPGSEPSTHRRTGMIVEPHGSQVAPNHTSAQGLTANQPAEVAPVLSPPLGGGCVGAFNTPPPNGD